MLGLQHLHLPNLRGRSESRSKVERRRDIQEAGSNEEFNFGMIEEVQTSRSYEEAKYMKDVWTNGRRLAKWRLARCRGSGQKNGLKLESIEQGGDIAKKGRANQVKAKTNPWARAKKKVN